MKSQIILIGPAGCGKTTIGKKFSQKYNYKWIDIDIYLHKGLNFPYKDTYTTQEFQKKKELELEILKSAIQRNKKIIISTCEGLFINTSKENLEKLKDILIGIKNIILLIPSKNMRDSEFTLLKQLEQRNDFKKEINFEEELNIYKQFAKKTIYTKDLTFEEIVEHIQCHI